MAQELIMAIPTPAWSLRGTSCLPTRWVRLDIFRETGHRTLRQAGVHHPLALITIFRSPDRALRRPCWQAHIGGSRTPAAASDP